MWDENVDAISQTIRRVHGHLNDLYDEWNTFQYVLRELDSWDGSSRVGTDVCEELKNQTNKLKNNIDSCKDLMNACNSYVSKVMSANSGR